FDIYNNKWDDELLEIFGVARPYLPHVKPSKSFFGAVEVGTEKVPLLAVSGDQESSLYAAGSAIGTTKVTFGSGVFLLQVVDEATARQEKDFFVTRTCDAENLLCVEKKIMRL